MADRFKNIGGMEEIKEEMYEVTDFLLNPAKYRALGARIPKGILFYGPPGTGKTLLARELSNEAHANFIYASGSEFIEKFVGVGAGRMRSLFEKAEKKRPSIIFIDELDAIGVSRNTDNNSERDQTLNQFLIEMDGFEQNEGIVVIGATNRYDMLDRALLRPGRFDRQIYIGNPCLRSREEILKVHCANKPMADDVDIHTIAMRTNGLSGAHLENIVNEAALLTVRKNRKKISKAEIDEAFIKVTAGLKNKNMTLSEKEKKYIACHESGHVLAECLLKDSIPQTVSIVPHGEALGFMIENDTEEKNLIDRQELVAQIKILLAGRAAEELVFAKLTTGAQDDLKKANEIAENMVFNLGMSERFGNRLLDRQYDMNMCAAVNAEIFRIIETAYAEVKSLLKENGASLRRLAAELYEKEVLNSSDIIRLIRLVPSMQ